MNTPLADQVIVSPRYCGPPRSGNGGYVAGLLAHELRGDHGVAPGLAVEVSLRQPPPLGVPLDVTRESTTAGMSAALRFGRAVIAAARTLEADIVAVEPVDRATASAASAGYPGPHVPPVPYLLRVRHRTPRRAPGLSGPGGARGRRQHPGRGHVDPGRGRRRHPAPDDRARVWRCRDPGLRRGDLGGFYCIGGWAGDPSERLMVLGRKTFTASALYDSDGRVVGRARHIWVAVDPTIFNETLQESSR